MPRRNLEQEFEAMGIEPDDAEFRQLEEEDRKFQEQRCQEDFHKDAQDFIAWRRQNRPANWKWGSGLSYSGKKTDSSC